MRKVYHRGGDGTSVLKCGRYGKAYLKRGSFTIGESLGEEWGKALDLLRVAYYN